MFMSASGIRPCFVLAFPLHRRKAHRGKGRALPFFKVYIFSRALRGLNLHQSEPDSANPGFAVGPFQIRT